jgi:glutamyl-Q tRNA(Asp) synthetase
VAWIDSINSAPAYVGRFAPSPTGPLHFGSIVAALASWLDARANAGQWLLRIEDLDPPRESISAPDIIKGQLEALGLTWDGTPLHQSTRLDAYETALARLVEIGAVFPCICSRKVVRGIYPGTCRDKEFSSDSDTISAIRFRVPSKSIRFMDRISGLHQFNLISEIGDFVVRRRDGRVAYQLAVVVDDAHQGITDIVRGDDLLDSTPRQNCLIETLGYQTIRYSHLPVVLGHDHKKLSKQAQATPISTENPVKILQDALNCLGQAKIDNTNSIESLLNEAIATWNPASIPHVSTVWPRQYSPD